MKTRKIIAIGYVGAAAMSLLLTGCQNSEDKEELIAGLEKTNTEMALADYSMMKDDAKGAVTKHELPSDNKKVKEWGEKHIKEPGVYHMISNGKTYVLMVGHANKILANADFTPKVKNKKTLMVAVNFREVEKEKGDNTTQNIDLLIVDGEYSKIETCKINLNS